VAELHALADHLGAYWHEVEGDAADALMQFAKAHRITQIVIGHSQRTRWWWPFGGAVARRLTRHAEAAAIDLHIVTRDPATTATRVDS
jgi:two-component system sensor histidine kinase KdpD